MAVIAGFSLLLVCYVRDMWRDIHSTMISLLSIAGSIITTGGLEYFCVRRGIAKSKCSEVFACASKARNLHTLCTGFLLKI